MADLAVTESGRDSRGVRNFYDDLRSFCMRSDFKFSVLFSYPFFHTQQANPGLRSIRMKSRERLTWNSLSKVSYAKRHVFGPIWTLTSAWSVEECRWMLLRAS